MSSKFACITEAALRRFAGGQLAEREIDQIEEHLSGCQVCLSTLSKVAGQDTLCDVMRGIPGESPEITKDGTEPARIPLAAAPLATQADEDQTNVDKAHVDLESHIFSMSMRTETSPTPPTVVIPGYEILGKLGAGGMGIVYKARHLKLDRLVALKMVLSGDHADVDALTRFRTEAEAIARLQHPNVVQIFEIGEHDGKPYFSLEYCDGGTLSQKINGAILHPEEVAKIIESLAGAMHVAHTKGIIHRDLKPANVLLMLDGTLKVTDFGLAKKLDDVGQTRTGAIMGTPSYMAPEQAAGRTHELGPTVDIYALGAMLYELLAGQPPFKAATAMEILNQVLDAEPVPPSKIRSGVPRDLETICLKALAKNPKHRYASARALGKDVARFIAGEPILARRHGVFTRGWRLMRRHAGKLAAAVGVLAVALALFLALAARSASQASALQKEIVTALDEDHLQGSDEYIAGVEAQIAKLKQINAAQSEAAANKLWERLGQWVQKQIRLAPEAVEAKERLQPTIGRIAANNPELAEGLRKQLEDRLERWDQVFHLAKPFSQVDRFLPLGQFRGDATSLQLVTPSGTAITNLLLTNQVSPRNSEARVIFAHPSWTESTELGLAFNALKQSGYTFVLRIRRPKNASTPSRIEADDETEGDVSLQIRRNGAILVQQKISAQALGPNPVEIWAKREGMRLICKLNQFKPLEFIDPFPLGVGEPGMFGLVATKPVDLTLFAAYRKGLAVTPGPLDQGDSLYEAKQFDEAIQHYRRQTASVSESELVQQARYKEAMCLVECKRESEAIDMLKELSNSTGGRWPVLAECQLYLRLARRHDVDSQAEASEILDHLLARDLGQHDLATLLPDETRTAFRELNPSYIDLFLATKKQKEHHVRLAKQILALEKRLQAEPGILKRAENYLLLAYRLAGREEDAETFTRQKLGHRDPVATTVLTHHSWILRTSGRAQEALGHLNHWQGKQPDDGLLLERARTNAELGNWTDAEQDLNKVIKAKNRNAVKAVEALCMKGFLRERAGDLKGAQDAWKEGMEVYQIIKQRSGSPFDPSVMRIINYWIMASMAGEMSDEDCRSIQRFFLDRNRAEGQLQQIAEVASSLLSPAVIREAWRTTRGRELARKWVFRQASYAETGLMPVYLIGAETLHRLAMPGVLSQEHDQLIWDLVQNGSRAYFDGKLGKEQIVTIGLMFRVTPWFWAGVEKTLDPSVRGPTAYLLGHRYLGRNLTQAESFFRSALSSVPPGSVLQRLAQSQLDKLKKL